MTRHAVENSVTLKINIKHIETELFSLSIAYNNTETTIVSQLPLTETELTEYRGLHEHLSGSFSNQSSQIFIRSLGQKLFGYLIGNHSTINSAYEHMLKPPDTRLKISLSTDNERRLMDHPWELLCDPERGFLGLSQRVSIIHNLSAYNSVEPTPVKLPLRVLAILPAPTILGTVNAEAEWELLTKSLKELQSAGILSIQRLVPPTYIALLRCLKTYDWDIIHFTSPILYDDATDEMAMVFEEKQNSSEFQLVKTSELTHELGKASTVRLIIINAPASSRQSIVGIGHQFQAVSSLSGICLSSMIPSAYQILVRKLYQELGMGQALESAITQARQELRDTLPTLDWAKPLIFAHTFSNSLFRLY